MSLVPGNNTLAANLMSGAWNSLTELHNVTTIGAAKSVAQKWAQNLPVHWTMSDLFPENAKYITDQQQQPTDKA